MGDRTTSTRRDDEENERTERPRIVCFHGFSQTADVFRARTGSLRSKKLKKKFDFVFLNAPHVVNGVFDDDVRDDAEDRNGTTVGDEARSWWLSGENVKTGIERAKDENWVRPAKSEQIVRLEETIDLVKREISKTNENGRRNKIVALIGFSQGATLLVLLKRFAPELFEDVERVITIAGFDPLDLSLMPRGDHLDVIACKSLHVHGECDSLVSRIRAEKLRDMFYAKHCAEFFEHAGGHGVPSSKPFRETFERFLLEIINA